MTAPLPLRFYNPVKELCEKVNLDYETVIGTGLSAKMRETFILADISKQLDEIDTNDLDEVKEKIEHYNQKYGTNISQDEDKGKTRYEGNLIVENLGTITMKASEEDLRYGKDNTKPINYIRPLKWFPGKGIVSKSEKEQ